MTAAFDAALAEYHRLRAAELVMPGYSSIEEEERHEEERDQALTATTRAFEAMVAISVADGPRVAAKLLALADFYNLDSYVVNGKAFKQVIAEISAALGVRT